MSNKAAGNRYHDAGLVIQARPEIDTTEFGLMEATFSFLTAISNWPAIQPAQGTPCSEFQYGDTATSTFLTGVSFLGAQTARWKPARLSDTACPGTLDVLCQGANFSLSIARRILTIAIASGGSGYTTRPDVLISGGTPLHNANVNTLLEVATCALTAAGTSYVVGDSLTVSGGAFNYPATIRVDSVSAGAIATFHVTNRGKYSRVPTNPASVTGGTGTSATFTLTWRVGFIHVVDGGLYTGTPTATLSAGNGRLGAITMSGSTSSGSLRITEPWKPVSTTKDTVQFTIFETTSIDPNAGVQVQYATTGGDLGAALYYTAADGTIQLVGIDASYPALTVDGSLVSVGDFLLLKDETIGYRNGIYRVITQGDTVSVPWTLRRAPPYDAATGFTTALNVLVQLGQSNAGTIWNCATNVTTLAPDDLSGGTSITFNSTDTTPDGVTTATYRTTIDYHTIDLHFEYMANQKLQEPRFVQSDYNSDGAGYIITDPDTGEKQLLDIDSILVESVTIDGTTGNTQYTPVNITGSQFDWQSHVRYLGTAARFEQTPAGQYWHIIETATIKIVPVGLSAT